MTEILLATETRQGRHSNYVTEARMNPNGNLIITESAEDGEVIDCVSLSPIFFATMLKGFLKMAPEELLARKF